MSPTFADAALDRVAQCLRVTRQAGESTAKVLVARYMSEGHYMPWDSVSEHSFAASLWADQSGLRFYTFCCLVEVGCAAGYIDIIGSSLRGPLEAATKRFIAEENLHKEILLLRNLLERLTSIGGFPAPNDQDAFHGFAAYLALNEAVWDDVEFHKLVDDCDEKWVEDKDAHFLLTPRHFAEAAMTGQVEGIDARAAAAGLRALEYFRSLTEFESRAENIPGLFDKALHAARWAHSVADVDTRLRHWWSRMIAWATDDEEDEAPQIGLVPMSVIHSRLEELGDARPPRISVVKETLDASRLMRLGRMGEAQRAIEDEFNRFSLPIEEELLLDYVQLCLDLADAGAREAAAVRLARVESRLSSGTSHWLEQGRNLLREIRTTGSTIRLRESVDTAVEASLTPAPSTALETQYLQTGGST
jgi:hypothetical protein